jgi:dTDP-4-dehydrorhamnose reductase
MKISIIGGSGFIGSYFVRSFLKIGNHMNYSFLKNKPIYKNGFQLDITNKKLVKEFFQKNNSDIVIFSSALTNVDLCESNPDLARTINIEGTENILKECKLYNSKLIYISTSAIFDGTKSEYTETDNPSPISVYGITKLEGEKRIKKSGIPFLILRTDQPYGWPEKWQHVNSVYRVVSNLKKNERHNEVIDWFNTPTYVPEFVHATNLLIEKEMEGIFHIVGSEYINRYEWALKIADLFGLKKELIHKINSADLDLKVKRSNVKLSNKKLSNKIGFEMSDIKEGLEKMLNDQINF